MKNTNGATAKTAATALTTATETGRVKWGIQNSGTNVLGVVFGPTTIYLKACTANDDGTGGGHVDEGPEPWDGLVTVTGSSPRYNVFEYLR